MNYLRLKLKNHQNKEQLRLENLYNVTQLVEILEIMEKEEKYL